MHLVIDDELVPGVIQNPLQTAEKILEIEGVPEDMRSPEIIAQEILAIAESLAARWKIYSQHAQWKESGHENAEPTYWDEDLGEERSGAAALAPCPLLNSTLSRLVHLVLTRHSQPALKKIHNLLNTSHQIKVLRQITISAEEAMEQDALQILFKIEKDYTSDELYAMVRELAAGSLVKSDLLESLITHTPSFLQTSYPSRYPGLVFQYFQNYFHLVRGELQLLRIPGILQNSSASYHYASPAELLKHNPILKTILQLNQTSSNTEIKDFVSTFPGLFGHQNLGEKTFTFVGAGFPLTGVILHIETGASVNLVDYDPTAVATARKFITMTEQLGITRPGSMKVILADATNILYVPAQPTLHGIKRFDNGCRAEICPLNNSEAKIIVPTDILDIASAIPRDVTARVIRENARLISTIRKRNVRGMSEILYNKFTLTPDSGYTVIGEVTSPQNYLLGASPHNLVVDFFPPFVVNSCQLYSNACNSRSKLDYLDDIKSSAVWSALCSEEGLKDQDISGPVWEDRVRLYYSMQHNNKLTK